MAIAEALSFLDENLITPALNDPNLDKKIRNKVQNAANRVRSFKKVGDLFTYLERFEGGKRADSVFNALEAHGHLTFERVLPKFKKKFDVYLKDRSTIDDFVVGEEYSSWDISNCAEIYNNQHGIFPIGNSRPHDAVLIKGQTSSGKYENAWLKKHFEFKYYFFSRTGVFDPNYKLNRAILESNGNPILLFLKNKGANYKYWGRFTLVKAVTENDESRWFHLIRDPNEEGRQPVSSEHLMAELDREVTESLSLPHEELQRRLSVSGGLPGQVATISMQFVRNPHIIAATLKRANGVCENCDKPAPFISKSTGMPFLEVHHVRRLADGGDDSIDNAIAVCPNCHRELHFG